VDREAVRDHQPFRTARVVAAREQLKGAAMIGLGALALR